MQAQRTKTTAQVPSRGSEGPSHDKIAALAYQLWLDRGCPVGSPEQDWLQAEDQLRTRCQQDTAREQTPRARHAGSGGA